MNERIRKLAEQVGYKSTRWDTTEQFEQFLDEFAELIIQECVSQCEKVASHADKMAKSKFVTDEGRMLNEGMWGGAKNCGVWIKKHFGVE